MNKSIAIFTKNIASNIDLIEKIKYFFTDRDDFIVFTDNIIYNTDNHGVLSTFYLIGYTGLLIFLDIDDYLEYKDDIFTDTALYLENYDGILDRNILRHCKLLTQSNNTLTWITNHELS